MKGKKGSSIIGSYIVINRGFEKIVNFLIRKIVEIKENKEEESE